MNNVVPLVNKLGYIVLDGSECPDYLELYFPYRVLRHDPPSGYEIELDNGDFVYALVGADVKCSHIAEFDCQWRFVKKAGKGV